MKLFRLCVMLAGFTIAVSANPAGRLVVFISIDQMRGDYLERYQKEFQGGFKFLTHEGIVFTEARLNYSGSATGPGHATLSTGVYPWKSGIVGNNYTDRATKRRMYCVEDSTADKVNGTGGFRSPKNLLVPTIGDWLKTASPASKVVSLSQKDRAAILLGGKRADGAFWYEAKSGTMTSSSYYCQALPEWVSVFNDQRWINTHVPDAWERLQARQKYDKYGRDDVQGETMWEGSCLFPHAIDPSRKLQLAFDTPFGNLMLLDFALAAVAGEHLGARGTTDLLCISLSSTDNIGSTYGPDSHEMLDNLLRIDRALGSFIHQLEQSLGSNNVAFVLSADHGVMPLPEVSTAWKGAQARRINNAVERSRFVRQLDSVIRAEWGIKETVIRSNVINGNVLKSHDHSIAEVENRIRATCQIIPGVDEVFFRSELENPSTAQRKYLDLYRHSFHTDRSPDILLRESENCLVTEDSVGTSHGSPLYYDTHVPLLFRGFGGKPNRVTRPVHTVDIAPTIAAILGIPVPADLDGKVLKEVVSGRTWTR